MDEGLLRIAGAQEPSPDKYTALATIKFIGGLQTQRSAFASIDTRYNSKFLGGKPDALIAGSNVEISNSLTLQRRPGLKAYGTVSIAPPKAFFDWQLATTNDLILVVDTSTGGVNSAGQIIRYSPTFAGVYVDKGLLSKQTNFFDVVNTLYLGNGVDRYKITGPNLLLQSNTFGTGAGTNFSIQSPWTQANVFSLTGGQVDPLGTSTATQLIWSTTGPTAKIEQDVTPNYTPIASNTFTFSLWMKQTGGANTVTLQISDQSGSIATQACVLTTSWVKYQVTGTMASNSNVIKVLLTSPTTTNTMVIYGAQLEVGGPATTTQITTTKAQGVWLWGIQAPPSAATLTFSSQVGNTGQPWQPNTAYTVGQTVIDSNGNLQKVTSAGTSGSAQPVWNTQVLGTTTDGIQNSIQQTNSSFTLASTASLAFQSNVTASNTLFAFIFGDIPNAGVTIAVSDNNGNTWSSVASSRGGDQHSYLYTVRSAAAGATTVTVTFSSPSAVSIWLGVAEVSGLTDLDVSNTNSARDSLTSLWNTGLVTTTNATDFLITFATISNNVGFGSEIGNPPAGFQSIVSQSGIQSRPNNGHFMNLGAFCEFLSNVTVINPSWTIVNPTNPNSLTGITAAYKTATGTLVWTNQGSAGAGLSPKTGYQYYYAFMNSYTGHLSNVSPISVSTGVQTGQIITASGVGMQTVASGPYATDPQVDTIVVFRNVDGGAFFFQIASFANPGSSGSAGTWNLSDIAPDNGVSVSTTLKLNGVPSTITEALNTSLYAPVALMNSLPPTGIINMEYFEGRMWGSVNNILYFNTAADNATLLGIQQNGVPSESWNPINAIPFNAPIVRSVATGGGLMVITTNDTWLVEGTNIVNGGFNPRLILAFHGVQSYNAVDKDGSTVYIYTSDRQCLMMNPNSGSTEIGYPIGDTLEDTFTPSSVYISRHVAGSRDNALYFADGSTGWYRLNPNQQGASMSGEVTPVWSPKADFTNSISGIGAIASIETSPGITKLLVGQTVTGPVLVRDLTTFSDNGSAYTWSATIGSILLTTPGKLAECESVTTEMNNISSAATQCAVSVLLDEISGSFESLPTGVSDPPQLATISSVLSERFYLMQGNVCPTCRHLQVKVAGGAQTTKDEILALTIRGALVSEQT